MTSARAINPVRLVVAAALAVALVITAITVIGGRGSDHEISVIVPKATGVIAGQYVRAGGSIVGEVADIEPVERGHAARVTLRLEDQAWPLPRGSRFTVRWGGTINLYNRYIALERGPDGPAMAQDGGTIPTAAFRVPVEYGELLGVFGKAARRDLKTFLNRSGLALDKAGPQLERALAVSPGAVGEADNVLGELDDSRADLEALVVSTGRVVDAIQTADPGLGELIVGAGTTLDTVAENVEGLKATLDAAPPTLRRATGTLKRADATLVAAQDVTSRLAPGAGELRRIAGPLNRVLGSLVDVGPDLRATLRTAGTGAPDLTRLVSRLGALAPQIGSIGKQADVALNCIRPYTPEIVSLGTLWSSALSSTDGKDKYIRAQPEVFLPAPHNAQYQNSGEAVAANRGLTYAFPRPPGTQAGQPWLLPECGAGADAFDPDKDPEARNFNPLSQMPPPSAPRTKERGR